MLILLTQSFTEVFLTLLKPIVQVVSLMDHVFGIFSIKTSPYQGHPELSPLCYTLRLLQLFFFFLTCKSVIRFELISGRV